MSDVNQNPFKLKTFTAALAAEARGALAGFRAVTPLLAAGLVLALGLSNPQIAWAQNGTVKIVKVASPHDAQDFSFTGTGPNGVVCCGAQLDDDAGAVGASNVLSDNKTFSLAPAIYIFKEDPMPSGWVLQSISCTPAGNASVDLSNRAVKVKVISNVNMTCTFTNKKTSVATGTVTVTKVVQPANDPGGFTLRLFHNPGPMQASAANVHNGGTLVATAPVGNYYVDEIAGSNSTNMNNYTNIITGPGCANGIVVLTAGANIACTITNTRLIPCVGYPMTANVNIYGPGMPFGPQTVDICRGGQVIFHNVNSGPTWTITPVSGPAFPLIPLPNNASGTTGPMATPGPAEYKINGANPILVHGHIIIH